MASLKFLVGGNEIGAGSGLAFFGDEGFGRSVRVGEWQGRTYVSNGGGTAQGVEAPNTKYLNSGSGVLGQTGSGVALTAIPNPQCPLNVRFEHDSPVQVVSAELRIYDRSDTNRPASGVTTKVAEVIHPDPVQNNNGSGDTTWLTPGGSGAVVSMAPSPGPSGLYAGNGANSTWSDTRHDWFLAISCSPDSIGGKSMYGLYVAVEYQ